jgi:hypothetical protein
MPGGSFSATPLLLLQLIGPVPESCHHLVEQRIFILQSSHCFVLRNWKLPRSTSDAALGLNKIRTRIAVRGSACLGENEKSVSHIIRSLELERETLKDKDSNSNKETAFLVCIRTTLAFHRHGDSPLEILPRNCGKLWCPTFISVILHVLAEITRSQVYFPLLHAECAKTALCTAHCVKTRHRVYCAFLITRARHRTTRLAPKKTQCCSQFKYLIPSTQTLT